MEEETKNTAEAEPLKEESSTVAPPVKKSERTYSRDEVNKMIATEKKRLEEELQTRQAEADRLAKMQTDERAAYEKEQAEKRAADAEAELNAYRLRDEANKLAAEQGVPLSLLDMLDFKRATAEEVAANVGKLAGMFNAAVKARLEEKLRQPPPQTHTGAAAGKEDLQKKLQEAQSANDYVKITYYSRLLAEQQKG